MNVKEHDNNSIVDNVGKRMRISIERQPNNNALVKDKNSPHQEVDLIFLKPF